MLSGVLLLCLVLTGCSQQPSAPSALPRQTSEKAVVADRTNVPTEQAEGASAGPESPSSATGSGDNLPVIEKVSLEPGSPVTGDHLQANVQTRGPAGDQAKILYRWKLDGRLVQESEDRVLQSPLHRGEFVELEVVAGNGASRGNPVTISTFVGNAAPTVRFSGQSLGSDGIYQANVEAVDPEGGPIRFLLKSGPPGMTIDASTGAVRWPVRADHTGESFGVLVAAQDSEGAETQLSYQIKTRLEAGQGTGNNANDAAPSKQ